MKLADLTEEGTVIFAGQFIMKEKNRGRLGIPDRNNFSLYHYGIKSKKNIVPYFFLERRELAYAFDVMTPEILACHTPGSYGDKVKAFQIYGFPVIGQVDKLSGYEEVKTKLNGFEKLKILYEHRRTNHTYWYILFF
jgi:hypothetical protein